MKKKKEALKYAKNIVYILFEKHGEIIDQFEIMKTINHEFESRVSRLRFCHIIPL